MSEINQRYRTGDINVQAIHMSIIEEYLFYHYVSWEIPEKARWIVTCNFLKIWIYGNACMMEQITFF